MKILPALKLPVLLALAGLLLNGCVCPANKRQGIPTITCQPVDTKVVEGKSSYLEVRTRQSNCRYEWFRIKATDQGPIEESQQSKTGGMSNRLIFEKVSKADRGVYYCTIIHETKGTKGDVPSRTRNVELMVLSTNRAPQVSTKTLASSGGGGTQACLPSGTYTTSLSFTVDDSGAPFTSLASGTCEITVTSSLSGLLPNTKYAARWTTSGAGNTGCINNTPTPTSRSFSVVKFLKDHTFTIYFKDPQTVGTTFQLSVTFKP